MNEMETVKARIEEIYDEIVAIRREIHMHPELSLQEEQTMERVSRWLTSLGIPHRTRVGGYGVVAEIGPRDADFAIGIRGDMDALPIQEKNEVPYASQVPGVMHACGHDLHTSILLGTAKLLKEMEPRLPGMVKLFFQPAEERTRGAKAMIAEGCLENPAVKKVIGLHVNPDVPCGKVRMTPGMGNSASSALNIKVHGSACHGAHPDHGADAILAAAHILTALQSVSSRAIAPTDPVIVTVGRIQGGTKGNIIAGEVEMEGTIRTQSAEVLRTVKQRVKEIAENAAASMGARAEVEIVDGSPPLCNDRAVTETLTRIAIEALGEENVILNHTCSMGAEDFAFFANAVPSSMFRLGAYQDNGHPQLLHNEWFCPDERCMKIGMLMEVMGALTLLREETERRGGSHE